MRSGACMRGYPTGDTRGLVSLETHHMWLRAPSANMARTCPGYLGMGTASHNDWYTGQRIRLGQCCGINDRDH